MKLDPRWWLAEGPDSPGGEDHRARRVVDVVTHLDEALKAVKLRMVKCARLYDPNVEFVGSELDLVANQFQEISRGPVTMNVVRSVIDTVTALIAKNRPRPVIMTDGADYGLQMQAKDLTRYLEAHFQRNDVYGDLVRMFKDACVAGMGAIKVCERDGKPYVERVLWDNLIVDDVECRVGPPRQLHEQRFIDRDMLLEMYGGDADVEEAIRKAWVDDKVRRLGSYRMIDSELIPVWEGWHLRSTPDASDGIHYIAIPGKILLWEEYEHDEFPFVFFHWNERLTGFWGSGLSEELAGIQNKINKINWTITQRHDLSNSYVLVEAIDAAMKLKPMGGPAEPLQFLPYRGKQKPEFVVPPAVQPELYQHLVYLTQQAYAIAGVSQATASSEKAKGLDSAIALQTQADLEASRFAIQSQHFEKSALQVARLILRVAREIAKSDANADMTTIWRSGKIVRKIDFRKVDMEETMYMMNIESASIQSRTPAGRLQAAMELGNAGLIDRETILRLIDHPDLSRTLSLENAAIDHAEAICEMLARGEYRQPTVLDQLPVAIKYVTKAYNIAQDTPNCPERVLDAFRTWIRYATNEMSRQPPAQPQPGMMPDPLMGAAPPMPQGPPGGDMNPGALIA